MVQLSEHVSQLEYGLDTELGEQGNTLSDGQKQLLAMARVLVQTPKILILDEATANIDSGTEQAIQKALQLIRRETTLVVIAHRLSTIVDADTIYVLNRGEMAESGSHLGVTGREGPLLPDVSAAAGRGITQRPGRELYPCTIIVRLFT